MIIGIGVDTVNIERFERIVTETPAFVRRVFTASERTRNLRSQAVRFAAKEALAKVLGAPAGLNWQDCEVASTESGQPYLVVSGTIAARARSLGINRLHLSLTTNLWPWLSPPQNTSTPANWSTCAGSTPKAIALPCSPQSPQAKHRRNV